ncbi:MAG: thioester reductase domain-containing protein, partial [Actinobacteria bacterium]|nr:thioester reductase domain-containing protein [Actinomycetota bacterium]
GRDKPVAGTVVRAAQALLGAAGGAPGLDAHFTDLGGDSLSALEFAALLQEIFGVEVPVAVVISPASDLAGVAAYIERARRPGTARAAFGTVHRGGSTVVRAADLTLEKFIDAAALAAAAGLPRSPGPAQGPDGARTVLLTGANGYLGRFLCLAWLERLAQTGGRLVCVIRGGSPEAARARLGGAFGQGGDGGDGDLPRHFRDLARGHLEVVPGDIGEPRLGLDERAWRELADAVDLIVHPAALVNHVLPYRQLLRPNVAGTAELIRLALTTRIKPVTFVSTVAAVAAQVSSADEDADIRVTSPERMLDDSYANGYATSKWAGEVLLRAAHDTFGLPVAVFRPGMILAHSRLAGQLNVPDMFTRLLLSLLTTGIAPGSFYATKDPAHFDGLPVDFVAAAVAALGSATVAGYRTYNVVNPHEDGISLDTYVDWLSGAGYVIKRIDDYATWLSRFETALRAQPDKQKQHSLLPLLHAFGKPAEAVAGSAVPASRFRAAIRNSGIGPGNDIPHVTPDLIRKYAADLTELGLI